MTGSDLKNYILLDFFNIEMKSQTTWNDFTTEVYFWDNGADTHYQTLTEDSLNPHPKCSVDVD